MKKIILPTIVLLLIAAGSLPKNETFAKSNAFTLSGDSGFVTKKEGLHFLSSHRLTEMKDPNWDLIKETDTIGKYYKVKESGNYFMCLIDYSSKYDFETHIVMEVSSTGKLIKSARFFHNNYACCWDNYYEGFNKTGNYFSLKICGTGLDYCGSQLYIFKDIIPQKQQRPIPCYYWITYGENSQSLSSTMKFAGDQLLVHYEQESGRFNDSEKFSIDSTKHFDVKFILKNNKWTTSDSSQFEGMPIW